MSRLILALSTGLIGIASSAHAVTISTGGQTIREGTRLAGFATTETGLVRERFARNSRCGMGSTSLTATGDFRITASTRFHRSLRPMGDVTCFLSVGRSAPGATAEMLIDVPAGQRVDYIGFYWGSIDEYNFVSFHDELGAPISLGGFGTELDGVEMTSTVAPGPLYRSIFTEFSFGQAELVRRVVLRTTNFALEIDNFSWRTVAFSPPIAPDAPINVPAPAAFLLFGAAALALSARRGASR